ncbi:aldo/keto reductase [Kiloniella majae]|uniref:aldo/keto reductase n=1 Tax=Kiloniella majae TaxID=1938558 RepID=UPI000A277693|nr:aldo/keto reductase [Kiloniella majae]
MNINKKIGLGTVQFGLDYGVSNINGQPSDHAVKAILERVVSSGLGYLDTASTYGDSEIRIGKYLPPSHSLSIVTKAPLFEPDVLTEKDGEKLYTHALQSLERLKQDCLYCLLIHHGSALTKTGSQYLLEALMRLKEEGLVKKTGISIYGAEELDKILTYFTPDLVQLPLNIFDQRLLKSGHIQRLKNMNVEVHLRSLYLQGLLLMHQDDLPDFFSSLKPAFSKLDHYCHVYNLSRVEICLAFGYHRPEVNGVIIGVSSESELDELIKSIPKIKTIDLDFSSLAQSCANVLNPSHWPTR